MAVRRGGGLDRARPRSVPADPDARAHALGAGPVRGDRSAALRPAPGRGRPRRPPRHRRADRRRGTGAARGGPGRLHRGAARRPASTAVRPRPVPTAAVNAALVLLADHELATSTMAVRVAASVRVRSLRRLPGRAGHAGRAAARWRQPAGLRAAGRGRARRRAARAERRAARAGPAARASGTPSTRAATRASTPC